MTGPGYWMDESSGVLRSAIEAYLSGEPMTPEHFVAMRAYFWQWIHAPVWDRNLHNGPQERAWLASMRAAVDGLESREEIASWIEAAADAGMDPL